MFKMKKNLFVISLELLCASCSKSDHENYQELIIGEWMSTNILIDGIEGNSIAPGIENSAVLSINDDSSYYRNYVTGSWLLNKSTLTLSPKELHELEDWKYKITKGRN